MDRTDCPIIEVVQGRTSGAPVVQGSRVRPAGLLLNADKGAVWLAEAHFLAVEHVEEVLASYDRYMRQLAPTI